jgi:hypothetical protein
MEAPIKYFSIKAGNRKPFSEKKVNLSNPNIL